LGKNSKFYSKLKAELPEFRLPFTQDNTPIILDLPDIAKPFTKKMDYPATARDGSSGELVNGYWFCGFARIQSSRENP